MLCIVLYNTSREVRQQCSILGKSNFESVQMLQGNCRFIFPYDRSISHHKIVNRQLDQLVVTFVISTRQLDQVAASRVVSKYNLIF